MNRRINDRQWRHKLSSHTNHLKKTLPKQTADRHRLPHYIWHEAFYEYLKDTPTFYKLYTRKEASEFLGVSEKQVWLYSAQHHLRYYKDKRKSLYRYGDLVIIKAYRKMIMNIESILNMSPLYVKDSPTFGKGHENPYHIKHKKLEIF